MRNCSADLGDLSLARAVHRSARQSTSKTGQKGEQMENTANIGLSRQMVLRRQMDVIANNIANMNTHGYKRQHSMFQEYLMDSGHTEIACGIRKN